MFDRGNKEFIVDMFLSCRKIVEYTRGLSFDEFVKDDKTLDAVVRNLEILGEAVKNLTDDFRKKYSEVEWSLIAKTRDKLIHYYFGIDNETLWKIVKSDIPDLLDKLRNIIQAEGWEGEIED